MSQSPRHNTNNYNQQQLSTPPQQQQQQLFYIPPTTPAIIQSPNYSIASIFSDYTTPLSSSLSSLSSLWSNDIEVTSQSKPFYIKYESTSSPPQQPTTTSSSSQQATSNQNNQIRYFNLSHLTLQQRDQVKRVIDNINDIEQSNHTALLSGSLSIIYQQPDTIITPNSQQQQPFQSQPHQQPHQSIHKM